jgi:hypothetical protein
VHFDDGREGGAVVDFMGSFYTGTLLPGLVFGDKIREKPPMIARRLLSLLPLCGRSLFLLGIGSRICWCDHRGPAKSCTAWCGAEASMVNPPERVWVPRIVLPGCCETGMLTYNDLALSRTVRIRAASSLNVYGFVINSTPGSRRP